MYLRRGCGSEQGPNMRGVVHVARDVSLTGISVAHTCGIGQPGLWSVWRSMCDERGFEGRTRKRGEGEDGGGVQAGEVMMRRVAPKGRHVVESG